MVALKILIGLSFFGAVIGLAAFWTAKNPLTFHIIAVAGCLLAVALIADAVGVKMPWSVIENILPSEVDKSVETVTDGKSDIAD